MLQWQFYLLLWSLWFTTPMELYKNDRINDIIRFLFLSFCGFMIGYNLYG